VPYAEKPSQDADCYRARGDVLRPGLARGRSSVVVHLGHAIHPELRHAPCQRKSATWTNNSTIPGWYHARTGTGTTIVANDGSSNAGNLYSYGTGTATDRALGSVGSGNTAVGNLFWGVRLQNNTGATITSLDVAYIGEQWRNGGGTGLAQTVTFSYLIGAPAVTGTLAEFQSAGLAVPALNFTSPVFSTTAATLNGNLDANRTALGFTISGLNIPNGTEVMLRWSDPDHPNNDHGLAIDDLSVTPHGVASTQPTLSINDVTQAEGQSGTTNFGFTVTLDSPAGPGGVTFDIATSNGTAEAGSDYVAQSLSSQVIAPGSSSFPFTVQVNGDMSPEPHETFFVTVTNIVGATAGDVQGSERFRTTTSASRTSTTFKAAAIPRPSPASP
jgi:hypothetical protein